MSTIGHNNPPDPIDTALAPFGDAIEEAQNWLNRRTLERMRRGVEGTHKA